MLKKNYLLMLTLHYYPRKISRINFKTDREISLLGKVIEVKPDGFILQDDTGEAEILSDKKVEEGEIVRVFCSIEGNKIKAKIVQSLNGLDLNLYKEVEELYSKAGV